MKSKGEMCFLMKKFAFRRKGPCPFLQGAEDLPPPSQVVSMGIKHNWPLALGTAWPPPAPEQQGSTISHSRAQGWRSGCPQHWFWPSHRWWPSLIACFHTCSPSFCLPGPLCRHPFWMLLSTLGQSFPEKHHHKCSMESFTKPSAAGMNLDSI